MTYSNLQILVTAVTSSLMLLAVSSSQSIAADGDPLEIPLWPSVAPGSEGYQQTENYDVRSHGEGIGWVTGVSRPTLTVYLPAAESGAGTGVVICPGGGYSGLAIDHEGHVLAKWFAERGVVAAVLKYRHGGGKHQHPVPLNDAQRALRVMRSHAKQWQLKPDQIGIAGFSAGGHLASTAGTRFNGGDATADEPIERVSSRANFLVLVYPVISMQESVTHQGSKTDLLGKDPDEALVRELSNEFMVTAETGPTFLAHAADDPSVVVENSLLFAQALRQHKVPVELHVYETGGHGFGMFRREGAADRWPDLLEGWLKVRKLIK